MVKEVIWEPGRTFSEFSLLTRLTTEECKLTDADLKTSLADGLILKIPLLSAAMTSVTGYDLALALGKAGGIAILPVKMSIDEQAKTVLRIKQHDLAFVEDPLSVRENTTIKEIVRKIEIHGHSTIPIVDRFQKFLGMFVQEHYWESQIDPRAKVTEAMIPYEPSNSSIDVCYDPNITVEQAKEKLKQIKGRYMIVLDSQQRLVKMAFKQDIADIKVGIAISTYPAWEQRVEKNIQAGADLIVIDTSDAYNVFTEKVIQEYKKKGFKVPLCVGNVITYDGAMFLMQAGADIIKVGMSSGSICTTQREKAIGRAPMTALLEIKKARDDYLKETGRYVSIIADGGISSSADMVIALSIADAIMMGGYFNGFYEANALKLDANKKPTSEEPKIAYIETWGEGSERARNLGRYGHTDKKTFFAEGVEGIVPYKGRLKPGLEKDLTKIKAALSNTGCKNLNEFRKNAVLELNSPHTSMIVSRPHNVESK